MLLLYSEHEVNINVYVSRLLEQVNNLSSGETKLPVLRIMFDALERICEKHDIFECGAFTLIGNSL